MSIPVNVFSTGQTSSAQISAHFVKFKLEAARDFSQTQKSKN